MRQYLVAALICVSLAISDAEHLLMLIGHLCVIFGEMSVQTLGPLLNWVIRDFVEL